MAQSCLLPSFFVCVFRGGFMKSIGGTFVLYLRTFYSTHLVSTLWERVRLKLEAANAVVRTIKSNIIFLSLTGFLTSGNRTTRLRCMLPCLTCIYFCV